MKRVASAEQARALFQRALDGELTQEEQADLQTALADDAELAEEFHALRRLQQAASELSEATPAVDVLAGVQAKLRARSGGRFYRDRFAEQQGRGALLTWAIFTSLITLLAALAWLAFQYGLGDH